MSGALSGAKRLLQDRETLVELVGCDVERRQQPDHVPVEAAGEEHETALERRRNDCLRPGRGAPGELEGEHGAEPAHLADLGMPVGERVEAGTERLAELTRAGQELR